MTPDLIAESGDAARRHAHALWQPPVAPLHPVQLPDQRQPDVLVFGDWSPRQDPAGTLGPRRLCDAHPGVQWHGARDCFVCEAAS